MLFVVVAMLLANLPATKHIYHQILNTELSIGVGKLWHFSINIEKFINDGLMVVFFFVVGLEIKHEIKEGQLSTPRKAILPVAYDRINLTVKKGDKEKIQAHAEARGESANGFINRAIAETMERDNREGEG